MQSKRFALMVADVQLGLFTAKEPIYRAKKLIDNINHLIDSARSSNIPLIFVQHSNDTLLKKGFEGYN